MKRHAGNRRGSAILLTMAILSLLMLIAIFFTLDTVQSSKISMSHKRTVQARLLQECGLNRALALIYDFEQMDRHDPTFLNPGAKNFFTDGDVTWAGLRLLPLQRNTSPVQADLGLAFQTSFVTSDSTKAWNYTSNNIGISALSQATWNSVIVDNQAIGQFTFLIIDQTGKLDPGYLATTSFSSKTSVDSVNITDLGLPPEYTVDSCLSFAHFALGTDPDATNSAIIRETLFPGTLADSDHFWFDANGDFLCDPGDEIFDRIDVTKIGAGGSISDAQLYSHLLTCDSSVTQYETVDSSLWAKGLTGSCAPSDLADLQKLSAQLIANVRDYTDADTTPSIYLVRNDGTLEVGPVYPLDASSTLGAGCQAAVLGVESRVVLSELVWQVYASDTVEITYGNGDTDLLADVYLDFKCRAGNPIAAISRSVRVLVDYSYSLEGKNLITQSTQSTFELTVSGSQADTEISDSMLFGSFCLSGADTFRLPYFSIDTVTVYEEDGTDSVLTQRFPSFLPPETVTSKFMEWTSDQWSDPFTASAPPPTNVAYSADVFAQDPLMAPVSPLASPSYWGGNVSSTSLSPSPRQIPLPFTSTAVGYSVTDYCAVTCPNMPITGLAELGRIHSPHTFNRSIKLWSDTPGEAYDSFLLELFSTNTNPRRTVNINTRSRLVINSLLTNVSDMNKRNKILDQWLNQNGAENGNPLPFRSDAHRFFSGVGFTTTSDQEAEEALCSFIELLNARQNYYTIISCARAIEDIGGQDDPTRRSVKIWASPDHYGVVKGMYKTISAIYRDAWGVEKPRILRTTVVED